MAGTYRDRKLNDRHQSNVVQHKELQHITPSALAIYYPADLAVPQHQYHCDSPVKKMSHQNLLITCRDTLEIIMSCATS